MNISKVNKEFSSVFEGKYENANMTLPNAVGCGENLEREGREKRVETVAASWEAKKERRTF